MQTRPVNRGRIRYDWWRAHHGLPNHAKWRGVARSAQVPVSVVFHIVMCLLDHASQATPRGSVEGFKPFDCAGVVDVMKSDVDRVLDILRDIHWIEGHMIAEWDGRQPQREDQNAAARKAEQRGKLLDTPPPPAPVSRNVTPPMRDKPPSHASEAGQDKVSSDVTSLAAPDREERILSSESVAARARDPTTIPVEPSSEQINPAGLLATALVDGALARPPDAEPAAKGKPISQLTRAELDAIYEQRRGKAA